MPRQAAVYRRYLRLQTLAGSHWHGSLAGRLIACAGFGRQGAEISLAATISGGVFLGIEPDAQQLKTAIRSATCDFMVNTLDEALRALKNEVRKQTPLSVGLHADISSTLEAMVERGVQPDLIANTQADTSPADGVLERKPSIGAKGGAALRQLAGRGAIEILFDNDADEIAQNSGSIEIIWSTDKLADMPQLDQAALKWLPQNDFIRRRWLEQAGKFFYRQFPMERVLGIRPEESDSLLNALRGAAPISSAALARWREPNGSQRTVNL
jgi:Urocanase Rossmann-like domain